MEIWFAHFMEPTFQVDGVNLAFEFAKSRGVIHYHAPLAMTHSKMDDVSTHLQSFALVVHDEMNVLDAWINYMHGLILSLSLPPWC